MIGLIRKIAVLMVIFSGVFLFLNMVLTDLLKLSNTSVLYAALQVTAMLALVILLVTKRIKVY